MTDILELDVASYATAIGHAAAVRLHQVLGPDSDPNYWFCDAGFVSELKDPEQAVNQLGAYVVERLQLGTEVHAEQLFIQAHGLGLHRHPASRFAELDLWVRVAFGVFASVVTLTAREMGRAQDEVRAEQARRQMAETVQVPVPVEDTVMEQDGDVHEKVFDEPPTAEPVTAAGDEGGGEAGGATGASPPPDEIAEAPVAPDAASATAAEGGDLPSAAPDQPVSRKKR